MAIALIVRGKRCKSTARSLRKYAVGLEGDMHPKKPDRFVQMTRKAQAVPGSYARKILDTDEIAQLLRRQYTVLQRLVVDQFCTRPLGVQAAPYEIALYNVLNVFNAYRKGTP